MVHLGKLSMLRTFGLLFHDTPIIDNQAYDHEVGWISRYHEFGVRSADRFVAINKKIQLAMQDRFGIQKAQIDLVYPGTDISRVLHRNVSSVLVAEHRSRFGLDPERQVFGMVGRLTQQKRPLDLVALAKRIGRGAQFVWVGSGDLQMEVHAAMQSVPNAHLFPAQSDVRSVYEMLDGLVITSEYEGLPLVLIEALATGLPGPEHGCRGDQGSFGPLRSRHDVRTRGQPYRIGTHFPAIPEGVARVASHSVRAGETSGRRFLVRPDGPGI